MDLSHFVAVSITSGPIANSSLARSAPMGVHLIVTPSPSCCRSCWWSPFSRMRGGIRASCWCEALIAVLDTALVLHPPNKYSSFAMCHLAFLLVHLHVHPYHDPLDNHLETASLSLIIFVASVLSVSPPPLSSALATVMGLFVSLPIVVTPLIIARRKYRHSRAAAGISSHDRCCGVKQLCADMCTRLRLLWTELDWRFNWRTYARTVIVLLLLIYSQICTTAFRYLLCVDVGEWSVSYFHPAVSCRDHRYTAGRIAVIFLVILEAALPVIVMYLAFRVRQLHTKRASEPGDGDSDVDATYVPLLETVRSSLRARTLMSCLLMTIARSLIEQSFVDNEVPNPALDASQRREILA